MRGWLAIAALAVLAQLMDGRSTALGQYDSASSYGSGGMSSYANPSGRQGMFGNRTRGSISRPGQGAFGSGDSFGTQGGDLSSARFMRGNRQPGDFIGGNSQDMQRFIGGAPEDANLGNWSPSGGPTSSWTPGGNNPNSRRNPNRNPQGEGGTPGQDVAHIRTAFQAAFDYPQPSSGQLSTSLTRRLAETPAIHTQTPIQVKLQGRTAILQGVALTEHDRLLAEQIVRLEAGIEAVKNEIEVGNPPTPVAPMPP
jgi:hypothetical protein